jgi:hypothetical protein
MAYPNAAALQRSQIQELVDLVAVDGLPDDKQDKLATLHLLAKSDTWIPTHCPETGIDLEGIDCVKHAAALWPDVVPASRMSTEATEREAALYRRAGVKVPPRRG